MGRDSHGGFGRAVMIDDPALRSQLAHVCEQPRIARLTTEHKHIPRQHVLRTARLQQTAQMTRNDLEDVDAPLAHGLCEGVGIECGISGQQVQGRAAGKRTEQDGVTKVGGDGRNHRHIGICLRPQPRQHRLHVVRQCAVRHRDALRRAGRAGGVDDVGGLGRMIGMRHESVGDVVIAPFGIEHETSQLLRCCEAVAGRDQ